jgi:hypothetical protein
MRRQSIVVAVVAWLTALLFAPNWAGAQQPSAKIPRVGIITQAATDKDDPRFDPLLPTQTSIFLCDT